MSCWKALGQSGFILLMLLVLVLVLSVVVLGGGYILNHFGVIPYVVANVLLVWLLGALVIWRSR